MFIVTCDAPRDAAAGKRSILATTYPAAIVMYLEVVVILWNTDNTEIDVRIRLYEGHNARVDEKPGGCRHRV